MQVYPTKDYAAFEDALDEFYAEPVVGKDPPQSAALAVAGPVVDNRCKMTNLSWLIDGHDLSRRRGVLCAAAANSLLCLRHRCRMHRIGSQLAGNWGIPSIRTCEVARVPGMLHNFREAGASH